MLSFSTTVQDIITAESKSIFWAFEILISDVGGLSFSNDGGLIFDDSGGLEFEDTSGNDYYWSTVTKTYDGNNYEFKIIPESFSGVSLNRNRSELYLHSLNSVEFDVTNKDNELVANDFVNQELILKLIMGDFTNERVIRQWRFIIKKVTPVVNKLHFYCVDIVQHNIKGDYPNTNFIRDIFISDESNLNDQSGDNKDNVCLPEPYGTAYIPIRSVYINEFNTYSSTKISAIASSNGSRCKIQQSDHSINDGLQLFNIGRLVNISGFSSTENNQSAVVLNKSSNEPASTAADWISFSELQGFTSEAAGNNITITQGNRAYLIGSTLYTYTISKIRSPRSYGRKSEWNSTAYSFTQYKRNNASSSGYILYQPIIHDINNDGTADAPGLWQQGETFLDIPTKFSRSDTVNYTNPADVIKTKLSNINVSSSCLKINSNLVGYWSLNDTASSSGYDASGSSNLLMHYGSPTTSTGIIGKSLLYSSSGQYSYVEGFNNLPTSQITVSCWVKFNNMKSFNDIVNHYWLGAVGTWIMYGSTAHVAFGIAATTALQETSIYNGNFADGSWHHLVGTYDGVDVRFYVDNTAASPTSTTGISLHQSSSTTLGIHANVGIGGRGYENMNYIDGYIDEVRIYNTSLTSSDVEELYYNPSMKGWWENARNTYYQRGLEFNGAFWYKETREKKLSVLLNMCFSALLIDDKIGLYPITNTSQKTIGKDVILTNGEITDESTLNTNDINEEISDCGYVAWQQSGESQDKFIQLLVPAKDNTKTKISNDIIEIPFVQDSQDIQKIGKLIYQRKLLRFSEVSFKSKCDLLELQPEDIITISNTDYGGTYDVLIDNMNINKDGSIEFKCFRFSEDLDDWDDLSPDAIVVYTDDPNAKSWEPVIAGPLTDENIGQIFQVWARPFLVVGPNSNQGDHTSIQSAINALEDSDREGILILSGIYSPTTSIHLIDRNVSIKGEGGGNVIINTPSGISSTEGFFILHNLTKSYRFSDFTINSTYHTRGSFYIYGDASSDNKSDIIIENLRFQMNGNLNRAVYAVHGKGKITMSNSIASSGFEGVYLNTYENFDIHNNLFNSFEVGLNLHADAGSTTAYLKYGNVISNEIRNFTRIGMQLTNCIGMTLSLNHLKYASSYSSTGWTIQGMQIYNCNKIKCISNTIDITISATSCIGDVKAIYSYGSKKSIIARNSINIDRNKDNNDYGTYCELIEDSQVINNIIDINNSNTSTSYNRIGISFSSNSDRNIIGANNIDLNNNTIREIGIYLSSNSDNNQGGDNITYRVGTSISDNGTGNAVTAKDV